MSMLPRELFRLPIGGAVAIHGVDQAMPHHIHGHLSDAAQYSHDLAEDGGVLNGDVVTRNRPGNRLPSPKSSLGRSQVSSMGRA
jgi:hypothetical protein